MNQALKFFTFILAALFVFGCSEKTKESQQRIEQKDSLNITPISDTLIGSKEITHELAGFNYRKRAKGYFLIIKNDTSDFMPVFMEAKEGGKVSLDLRFQKSKSYREQYNELKKILPSASKDFILDSLRSIAIGRLVSTGDLAIEISKQAIDSGELNNRSPDYSKISSFVKESKLGEDFTNLLEPYHLSVSGVSVEKVFFTSASDLRNQSKIETDSAQLPEKILDCQTWIKIKPANSQ